MNRIFNKQNFVFRVFTSVSKKALTENFIRSYVLLCIFTSVFYNARGQDNPEKEASGVFEKSNLADNWYISAGAGTQLFLSKDAGELSFKERFTPFAGLAAGKWFSPYCGIQLQVQGYSLNGYSNNYGNYIGDPEKGHGVVYGNYDPVTEHVNIHPDGSYPRYIHYLNTHLDIQTSAVSLFTSYNSDRKWDIIPAVGLGYTSVFDYMGIPATHVMSANFSIACKWKLTDKLDASLEVDDALFPDQFDGRIAGTTYESNFGAMFKIAFKPGKQGFRALSYNREPETVDYAGYVAPVVPPIIVKDTVFIEKQVLVKVPVKTELKPFILSSVQFASEQWKITPSEEINVVNAVGFLQNNAGTKLRIAGYADRLTGDENYNAKLAKLRVNEVYSVLIHKYGIAQDKIEIQVCGSTAQVYDVNKWNRVVTLTVFSPAE